MDIGAHDVAQADFKLAAAVWFQLLVCWDCESDVLLKSCSFRLTRVCRASALPQLPSSEHLTVRCRSRPGVKVILTDDRARLFSWVTCPKYANCDQCMMAQLPASSARQLPWGTAEAPGWHTMGLRTSLPATPGLKVHRCTVES